jgi:hypothetical protein
VLILPATQTTNNTVTFSVAQGNGITVNDVNAETLPLDVSLAAVNGYITLGSTAGLQLLTGTGRNDSTVSFTGSLADVQAALEGLKFQAVSSQGLVQISVTDPGTPAWGGPRTTTGTVGISLFIQPIPVIPSLPDPAAPPSPDPATVSPPGAGPVQPKPNIPPAVSPTVPPTANPTVPPTVNPTVPPATPTSPHRTATGDVPGESVLDRSDRPWQPLSSVAAVYRPLESVGESALAPPRRDKAHGLPARTKETARSLVAAESPLDAAMLWQQCGSIGAQLERQQWSTKITVGAGVALTAGVSAGYVILLFRGGSLLASTLASLPAWRSMDPLPVIEYWERDEERRRRLGHKGKQPEPPEQSLESLVK